MSSFVAIRSARHGWKVERSGARRCIKARLTRGEAWKEARRLARGAGGKAYLLGVKGRIIARNSYA